MSRSAPSSPPRGRAASPANAKRRRALRSKRLRRIPWGLARRFLEQAAAEGFDADDAIESATLILDAAMPLDVAVPGPLGVALEAVDGPLIRAGLTLMWAGIAARVDELEAGPPPPPGLPTEGQ